MKITVTLTKAEAAAILSHPAPRYADGVRRSKAIESAYAKIQAAVQEDQ